MPIACTDILSLIVDMTELRRLILVLSNKKVISTFLIMYLIIFRV